MSRLRVSALAVLVVGGLSILFGCRTIDRTLQEAHIPCGVYRWRVKILTDTDAESVRFEPVDATIHDLIGLPRPPEARERRLGGVEFQVYRVKAVLEDVRPRIDQDLHLLLRDPADPEARMIAEIPNPRCTLESRYMAAFAAVRHVAESLQKTHGGTLVEVVGPGFFDMPETRIGGAPNGFELHPVLKLTVIEPPNSSGQSIHRRVAVLPSPRPLPVGEGVQRPGYRRVAVIANRTSLFPAMRPAIAPIRRLSISRRNAALQAKRLAKRRPHASE